MITFAKERVDIGEIKAGSVNDVIFEFSGDKSDILEVVPHCGCTAEVEIQDGKIKCVFTEKGDRSNISDVKKFFPSGYETILKGLSVYINDGQEMYILKDKGMERNPDKKKINIEFTAKVKVWE